MAENYFSKFPAVAYGNTYAIDLTERATILTSVPQSPFVYYSYDVSNGQRPDEIADSYYNDQYMDWLIYLSNGIIDPYYQWYLPNDKFNTFLQAKYETTIADLQNKISYYRNNWYNGDQISVSDYNALPSNHHRYYEDFRNVDTGEILKYVRTRYDWTINTNALVGVTCSANSFTNNEVVYINFNGAHIGRGQVSFSNNTNLVLQHVSGTLYTNAEVSITGSSYVYGTDSTTNVAFTATTSISNNIVTGEEIYWDSVSIYDYENEKNEQRRTIKVLDNGISGSVSSRLTEVLAQ
jgi:hypothetical protein